MLVLLEADYKVVVLDNLDNSFQKAYDRMVELAGDKAKNMTFVQVGWRPRSHEGADGWLGSGWLAASSAWQARRQLSMRAYPPLLAGNGMF